MIAMLDTSEDLEICEAEVGCPVEQLPTREGGRKLEPACGLCGCREEGETECLSG